MTDRPLFMHVRDLARAGKLDRHLPDVETIAGIWPLWFWIVAWFAFVSAGIAIACFALEERPPGAPHDLAHPSVYTALLLIPFGALCWVMSHLTVPKSERRRKRLGRRGAVVPAAIVQVNDGWYEPDNDRSWPGSVVVSFDPTAPERTDGLQEVAEALFALKRADRRELPPDQVPVAWALYHHLCPHRAVPVPAALSQGLADCWLFYAPVPPHPLRHEDVPLALALPGDPSHEAVALLPDEIL